MALDPIQEAAREQFSRQSRNYGRSHILADVSDVKEALLHVALPTKARVLDVACGAGHTGLHLASLGHEVTSADLSDAMLERVREAAAERGLAVTTRQHPAEAMPYADASFDLVTCRIAPHHFSSPRDFVREVARVLAPGGFFLLIDGSVPDDEAEAEAWLHEVEKLRDPSHARLLSTKAWRELCAAAGLAVLHAELRTLKQPDLEWYFETAATPAENRVRVRDLVANASPHIREIFRIGEEDGKTVWWWPRLTLVAQRPPQP
jgi:ubiquinone/menaquinone biosynthesis C-methylase UbiE